MADLAPRRVLVVQLRRLGDVVLSAGLLEDLRVALPHAALDLLVGVAAAPLLEHHPLVDTRIVYDPRYPARMARLVRSRRYDWVIDVQSNPRTAMLTRASGAPVRAGWDIGFWAWAYTHTLPRAGRPVEYVLRERQRLLEMLDVPVGPPRTRLVVTVAELERADSELEAGGAPAGMPRAALSLSATTRVREWPVEQFAGLATMLLADGVVPVALQNPGDGDRVARLRALEPRVVAVQTHHLRHMLATIARCGVLVSADSGPAHMATALGVPRVTIFGPTNPAAWSPGTATTRAVRAPGSVVMTTKQWARASEDHAGITGVTVATVLDQVRDLLQLDPSTVPALPGA
ncbi:MAG: glycosyltransferase family 9 protein [Gemmatimonadota bacterium]|nr:glycosyltransferase family 9 protein [Gemmatimonadota bacterium]